MPLLPPPLALSVSGGGDGGGLTPSPPPTYLSAGRSAGFHSMRVGLESSFAAAHSTECVGLLGGAPGTPPYVSWLSYREVGARVRALAAALDTLARGSGRAPAPGASRPFVAIFGPNAVDWLAADLAAAGSFLPTVGVHPDWPAASVAGALELTRAPILVLTSAALLATVAEAERAPGRAHALEHVVVLDPEAGEGEVAASVAAVALAARGARVWAAASDEGALAARAARLAHAHAPAALLPVEALTRLAARVAGAAAPGAVDAQWARLLAAAGADGYDSATPGGSRVVPLFVAPEARWLRRAAAEEAAREAAARAAPLAGEPPGAPPAGPLYFPLAEDAMVEAARASGACLGQGGADWVVAQEQGSVEAAFDIVGLWAVVFATGSSGKLKATPYTRASWASLQGCNSGASELMPNADGNNTVLSHCAMSHGLDRGFYWKALLARGRVGVARGHGFEAIREAMGAFKPVLFCTMPSFWERLYLEAREDVRRALEAEGCARGLPPAAAAGVAAEQLACLPSMLLEQVGGRSPAALPVHGSHPTLPLRSPARKWTDAIATRPAGSLAPVVERVAGALRRELKRDPADTVKFFTGGAPVSWEVLAFFNFLVFDGNFRNAYAATEAAPIGEGCFALSADGVMRLSACPAAGAAAGEARAWEDTNALAVEFSRNWGGQEDGGRPCGELEVRGVGAAARRYFGAEYDASAAAQSRAAFTPDGWWRSEDLVELFSSPGSSDKWLRVLGRKNDRLEMYYDGNSVYYPAAPLTAELAKCAAVHNHTHLVLHCKRDEGEGKDSEGRRCSALVAVVVPAEGWLRGWAAQRPEFGGGAAAPPDRAGVEAAAGADPALAAALKRALLAELGAAAAAAGLPPHWAPGGVVVEFTPWTRASGILLVMDKPPSRSKVLALYARAIDEELARVLGFSGGGAPAALAPAPTAAAAAAAGADAADAFAALAARVGVCAATPEDSPLWGVLADLWGSSSVRAGAGWQGGRVTLNEAMCAVGEGTWMSDKWKRLLKRSVPIAAAGAALGRLTPPELGALTLHVVRVAAPSTVFVPEADKAKFQGDVVVAEFAGACDPEGVVKDRAMTVLRRGAAALGLPPAAWPVALFKHDAAVDGAQRAADAHQGNWFAEPTNAHQWEKAVPSHKEKVAMLRRYDAKPYFIKPETARLRRAWAAFLEAGEGLLDAVARSAPAHAAAAAAKAAAAAAPVDAALADLYASLEALEALLRALAGEGGGGGSDATAVPALAAAVDAVAAARTRLAAERSEASGAASNAGGHAPEVEAALSRAEGATAALEALGKTLGYPLPPLAFRGPAWYLGYFAEGGGVAAMGLAAYTIKCSFTGETLSKGCEWEWAERFKSSDSSTVVGGRAYPLLEAALGAWHGGGVRERLGAHAAGLAAEHPHRAALDRCGAQLEAMLPDFSRGALYVREEGSDASALQKLFTGTMREGKYVMEATPTPATFVAAAFAAWGERPCLGLPVDKAQHCSIARLFPPGGAAAAAQAPPTAPPLPPSLPAFTVQRDFLAPPGALRPFAWLSFNAVGALAAAFSRALLGMPRMRVHSYVGISGPNVPEWAVADWGSALANARNCGFHTTYSVEELAHAVRLVQPVVLVVAREQLWKWFALWALGEDADSVATALVMVRPEAVAGAVADAREKAAAFLAALPPPRADAAAPRAAAPHSPALHAFSEALLPDNVWEVEARRKRFVPSPLLISPGAAFSSPAEHFIREDRLFDNALDQFSKEDPDFTVLFTSGTSGKAKGVRFGRTAWRRDVGDGQGKTNHVTHQITCSFIPLSHGSDRIRIWDTLGRGGRTGFCEYAAENWGEHEKGKKDGLLQEHANANANNCYRLLEDVAALRPTSAAFPPRIWNGLRFMWALARGEGGGGAAAGGAAAPALAAAVKAAGSDMWVRILRGAAHLKEALGGRVAVYAAGGAAPDPATVEWLKGQFPGGAAYHESYGCTECGAVAEDGALMERSTGRFAEGKLLELGPGAGAAGFPWPQFGEMVVRTPTMASGYLLDKKATNRAFIANGYYRTGDIVEVVQNTCADAPPEWLEVPPEGASVADGTRQLRLLGEGARIRIVERVSALVALAGGALFSPGRVEAPLRSAAKAAGADATHLACVVLNEKRTVVVVLALEPAACAALPWADGEMAAAAWQGAPPSSGGGAARGGGGTPTSAAARAAQLLNWALEMIGKAYPNPAECPHMPGALLLTRACEWSTEGPHKFLNVQHKVAVRCAAWAHVGVGGCVFLPPPPPTHTHTFTPPHTHTHTCRRKRWRHTLRGCWGFLYEAAARARFISLSPASGTPVRGGVFVPRFLGVFRSTASGGRARWVWAREGRRGHFCGEIRAQQQNARRTRSSSPKLY
jgi:long-subunit acyl-CoA synthetase (AMP-forming)